MTNREYLEEQNTSDYAFTILCKISELQEENINTALEIYEVNWKVERELSKWLDEERE